MHTAKRLLSLALFLPLLVTGCAADAEGEGDETASSEDELRALSTSEVVGTIRSNWYAGTADAPLGGRGPTYRAFKFEASAGNALTAYVAASNGTDAVAYILDANLRTLKQNDNRDARTKDAVIDFTPPTTGTYYLAFRNKERQPAKILARIVEGGTKTKTFADGWPVRQVRYSESPYAYEQTKNEVLVTASVDAGATVITNYSKCPDQPFTAGAGMTMGGSASFTVDPVARTIRASSGVVGGRAEIAADGTFTLDSGRDRWGFIRATGRVAAGGFVFVTSTETMACHTNYAGEFVHNAQKFAAGAGAADPNYR
jgi:hypothetical protein